MDQSPAACLASAHATDGVHGGATHVGGVGDLSFGVLLRTGAGRGGENLLPTCVLCHVNRSTTGLGTGRNACEIQGCAPLFHTCATHPSWLRFPSPRRANMLSHQT